MKKMAIYAMCVMLVLALVGCGNQDLDDPGNQQMPDPPVSTDPSETPPVEEPPVEEPPVEEPPVEETLDLAALYETGMAHFEGGEVEAPFLFPESNLEYLNNFYPGIVDVPLKQHYFAMAPVTNAPLEIAMVEVENEDDAQTVKEIFQGRVDLLSDDSAYPEEAAAWKNNARVTSRGCYVFLAVLSDDYELPEEFILD